MKKSQLKLLSYCTGACLLATTAFVWADDTATTTPSTDHRTSSTESRSATGKSIQFHKTKDLVGANVKDSAGQKVGDVSEIYINPENGVSLAAIGLSGKRYALVPVQALSVNRNGGVLKNAELSVNKTKADLESGPLVTDSQWDKLDDTKFTQSIFGHYSLQMPSSTGAASSPGGVSSGTETKPSPR